MLVFVDVCFDCFCCVYLGDRLFDCILVAGFAVMIICGGFGLIAMVLACGAVAWVCGVLVSILVGLRVLLFICMGL